MSNRRTIHIHLVVVVHERLNLDDGLLLDFFTFLNNLTFLLLFLLVVENYHVGTCNVRLHVLGLVGVGRRLRSLLLLHGLAQLLLSLQTFLALLLFDFS